MAFTCRHASHTSSLGIANGLSCVVGMFIFASSQDHTALVDRNDIPVSRPLRSTTTPASSGFTANTGRSASERRDRYSVPSVSASARSLSRPSGPATPVVGFDARLLTFRARAADQAHAASTPGTAWPGTRAPARLNPEGQTNPRFRRHLQLSTLPQRTPHRSIPAGRFWNVFLVPT